jgi:hypothetical protein
MRSGYLGLGSAGFLSFSAGSASAQRVSADIRIGGRGPVSGHVRIESRDRYRDRYYRDAATAARGRSTSSGAMIAAGIAGGLSNSTARRRSWSSIMTAGTTATTIGASIPGSEIRVYERDGRYYRMDDRDWDDRYDDRRGDWRDDLRDDDRYRRDGRDDWYDRDRRGGRDGWDDRDRRDGRGW